MANMVDHKSWYGGRFAEQNRGTYLQRRIRAEEQMYQEFSRKYWVLKECCPVYFYLYPHFSLDEIQAKLDERKKYDEPHTKYLLIPLAELEDDTNISFTISDSMTSYRDKIVCQEEIVKVENLHPKPPKYAEYGSVFHISEIALFIEKYEHVEDLCFEVQIWDTSLLRKWKPRTKTH